jgi:hypothetical protein
MSDWYKSQWRVALEARDMSRRPGADRGTMAEAVVLRRQSWTLPVTETFRRWVRVKEKCPHSPAKWSS